MKYIVTTQEFWDVMCNPRFIRTGLYSGSIGKDIYLTSKPPEKVPGFMKNAISNIMADLGRKMKSQ